MNDVDKAERLIQTIELLQDFVHKLHHSDKVQHKSIATANQALKEAKEALMNYVEQKEKEEQA